jgi:cytochrome c biogenesis protein CcdA
MLLALILPLFAMLLANSVTLYAILAIALVASGLHVMCGSERACHGCPMPERQSIGAAFGAGLTSSAILSPCCTPLVLGILSSQGQTGHPQTAALLLGAFAVGHAVPMVAIALSLSVPLRRLSDWAKGDSAAIVTGALQIGVGVFYAVLA